eukprot:CAMPEP_0182417316 /NCGR_PEP_ID=MMETSP1167-20130531/1748_1 /TAXON_ID=2988 /ORGANISM="Mallomonas Sp, Strain CCMP3275" /LENGTH=211 /DNA_ID=CAMNT_0024590761 /DNA_START=143 /DNA_END=778 /DNA_ORIENTATION=-
MSTIDTSHQLDLVSELDKSRKSKKLFKKLDRSPKKELSEISIGIRDAEGAHVADILNEALGSNAFIGTFRGISDASSMIEIAAVRIIGDGSKLVALWTSSYLESFLINVKEKHGTGDANRMSANVTKYITQRLQKKEPHFRAVLVRKMDFKRVPRLSFYVHQDWCQREEEREGELEEREKEREREGGGRERENEREKLLGESERERENSTV